MLQGHRTSERSTRSHSRTLAAFTLIELLVVVAMLALITVGIARIFKSAGDTARAGRRVSTTNTFATLIERQLREDFAAMTRSGFLVIRNQTAGSTAPSYSGAAVALAPGVSGPRQRRVDEILFFAKGDFASQRTPIHPDRAPRSTEAMIYYGHGLKWNPSNANYRADLRLDNDNIEAPGFGAAGPDQYASDWILSRRAYVLQPPNQIPSSVLPSGLSEPNSVWSGPPRNPVQPNNIWEDIDRNIQIGLQPAAISAFRIISNDNGNILPNNANVVRDETPVQRPRLSSGIVDVIATSLSEIRDVVVDAQSINPQYYTVPFSLNSDMRVATDPLGDPLPNTIGASFQVDAQPGQPNSVTKRMHEWMRQAFPADSDNGRRVRVESEPPDWTGTRDSANAAPYDKEYKRTDQEMLASFNFVPHCTEFIVEWSFGVTYPADFPTASLRGQIMWHGKYRLADLNGDGNPAPTQAPPTAPPALNPEVVARPYGASPAVPDTYFQPIRLTNGGVVYSTVRREVVQPDVSFTGGGDAAHYSYFGYINPTWRVRAIPFDDANGNGVFDVTGTPPYNVPELQCGNGDPWFEPSFATLPGLLPERRLPGDPDTVPWPWPKLVRITMSLVDPQDPRNEQTFQFTFEVPDDSQGSTNF